MNLQFLDALVPALLHTLWMGVVAGAFLFVALRTIHVSRSRLRYVLGIVALSIVFLGGLVAWEWPEGRVMVEPPIVVQSNSSEAPVSLNSARIRKEPRSNPRLPSVAQPRPKPNWRVIVGIVWMIGSCLSLLRLVRITVYIQHLVRRSRIIENPVVTQLMLDLSKAAGFSRRVLLLTGKHIIQPSVIGVLRPVIFLPASALTGLPEWQLRAILAHELAHIVRHDFLVNALQLLAETILFFNPAVWWINRRIREEREACCDALAAEWVNSKTALAETLIDQAAVQSSALPAFGGTDSSSLKNRILRLINPSRTSHLKLPWKSLLLVMIFAVTGLFLAKRGTAEMVGYIQRLQKLETARNQYETPTQKILRGSSPQLKNMWIELSIKTEDGAPVPLPLRMECSNRGGSWSAEVNVSARDRVETVNESDATFKVNVSSLAELGHVERFSIRADGYAQYSGIGASADANGIVRVAPVVLSKGFVGRIRFIDPAGNPVPGLKVSASEISISGSYSILPPVPVDQNGILPVENCMDQAFQIKLYPPDGYAYDEGKLVFKSGETRQWQLIPAKPFSGTIVDPTGKPIKGARIRLLNNRGLSLRSVPFTPIETQTDGQGAFSFSRMLPSEKYTLAIDADGYFGKFVKSLSASDSGRRIVLKPGGRLTVHFTHIHSSKSFYCWRGYTYVSDDGGRQTAGVPEAWMNELSKTDQEAIYECTHIWEGQNYISTDGLNYAFEAPFTNDTLTLNVADLREKQRQSARESIPVDIRLNLIPPENEPFPTGSVKLDYVSGDCGKAVSVPIPPDGIIQTNLMMNANSAITISSGSDLKGYAVYENFRVALTNLEVDCPLLPAGGIVLNCKDSDGNPVTGYSVGVGIWHESKSENSYHSVVDDNFMMLSPRQTESSTCMLEPLDFENKYRVRVYKSQPDEEGGTIEYTSKWFRLSKYRPIRKMTCVLKPRD